MLSCFFDDDEVGLNVHICCRVFCFVFDELMLNVHRCHLTY